MSSYPRGDRRRKTGCWVIEDMLFCLIRRLGRVELVVIFRVVVVWLLGLRVQCVQVMEQIIKFEQGLNRHC